MASAEQQNRREKEAAVDLSTRLALRPKEAAAALWIILVLGVRNVFGR